MPHQLWLTGLPTSHVMLTSTLNAVPTGFGCFNLGAVPGLGFGPLCPEHVGGEGITC